jgi:hypothetical protein
MQIPDIVKIQGHMVRIQACPRGYVRIGETLIDMDSDTKQKLTDNAEEWEKEMFRMYEIALKQERLRVKNG